MLARSFLGRALAGSVITKVAAWHQISIAQIDILIYHANKLTNNSIQKDSLHGSDCYPTFVYVQKAILVPLLLHQLISND